MAIRFKHKGDFRKTENFFKNVSNGIKTHLLEQYAQEGVNALASATPKDSGVTAASWGYRIEQKNGNISIIWTNSNVNKGVNIAIILQYGHGTGTGGYVEGIDYINPAIRPIFDKISEKVWKEVTSA